MLLQQQAAVGAGEGRRGSQAAGEGPRVAVGEERGGGVAAEVDEGAALAGGTLLPLSAPAPVVFGGPVEELPASSGAAFPTVGGGSLEDALQTTVPLEDAAPPVSSLEDAPRVSSLEDAPRVSSLEDAPPVSVEQDVAVVAVAERQLPATIGGEQAPATIGGEDEGATVLQDAPAMGSENVVDETMGSESVVDETQPASPTVPLEETSASTGRDPDPPQDTARDLRDYLPAAEDEHAAVPGTVEAAEDASGRTDFFEKKFFVPRRSGRSMACR